MAEPGGAGPDDAHPPPLLTPFPHHHVQRSHAVQGTLFMFLKSHTLPLYSPPLPHHHVQRSQAVQGTLPGVPHSSFFKVSQDERFF